MLVLVAFGILGLLAFTLGNEEAPVTVENWTRYDATFKKWAAVYSVPWTWLKAIALNESSLGNYPTVAEGIRNPANVEGSKSQDGKSWGLMQMILPTAREVDPVLKNLSDYEVAKRLNNPDYSIQLAAKYLSQLSTQFPSPLSRRVEWIIKSYNQGPGNTRKEMDGRSSGFAHEYWTRFQRNLEKVENT